MEVKRAMMISVGCRDWKHPKIVFVSTSGEYGRLIKDIAKEAFEKYKSTQKNEDIYMFDYSYYGDIEVLTT